MFGALKCIEMNKMLNDWDFDWFRLKGDLRYTFWVNALFAVFVGIGFLRNLYGFFVYWSDFGADAWKSYLIYIIFLYLMLGLSLSLCLWVLLSKQQGVKTALDVLGGPRSPATSDITNQNQPDDNYAYPKEEVQPENFGDGGLGEQQVQTEGDTSITAF